MTEIPNDNCLRLLVVDDDILDQQATRRVLQKSGLCFEIDAASSVAGALEALEHTAYDCALLDFTLPDGDGLLLLQQAQTRGISTPLIMLTGQADDLIAVELMKAGAADYLPKSKISPENLGRAIQSVHRLHQAQTLTAQADHARLLSEIQFRRVAESNIIGIVFWETDGTISDANSVFLDMIGFSREEMQAGAFNWREMTPKQYWPIDDEKIAELRLTGACLPWEKELRCKDGSLVAVLISVSFLEPPDRKGLAFVVDITERKRALDAQKFLADVSTVLSVSPYYLQTLPEAARLAVPAVADCCLIDLVEHGELRRIAISCGDTAWEEDAWNTEFPLRSDAVHGPGTVLRTGQPETVFEGIQTSGVGSYLSVPIVSRGQAIGAITWIYFQSSRCCTPFQLELAAQLSQRVALAIDNARLLFETQARAERESVVNAIGHSLRASLDADEIIQVAVREVGQALAVSHCLWCWIGPARDGLTVAPQQFHQPGLTPHEDGVILRGVPPDVLARWMGSDAIVVSDLANDPQSSLSALPAHWNIGAFAACPVRLRGDRQGLFMVQQAGGARQWSEPEIALLRQVSDLLAPALENAYLYAREHRVADMLQAAFLSNIPDEMLGLELATVYRAGLDESQVGGDCYDVFPLPDGRVGLVIADVSGKGLGAAVLTATVKYSLRAFAAEVAAPSLVLTRLNRMLCMEATGMGDHFVTLFYAVFDQANGRLTYASAGHETQLIRRASGVTLLHATGSILGIGEQRFEQEEEHLEPNDALVLYTDGLTEARNPETRELLDVERVSALLEQLPAGAGAGAMTASLERLALDWARGRPHDDMALLVARRMGKAREAAPPALPEDGENLFNLTFSSRATHAADVRQAVSHWMETLSFDRRATEDFLTAVTEAVTNAVRHGSPHGERDQFHIQASARGGELIVEVRDHGPGLSGQDTSRPMPEPDEVSGRGLPLISMCADEVSYVAGADGLCVQMRKGPRSLP